MLVKVNRVIRARIKKGRGKVKIGHMHEARGVLPKERGKNVPSIKLFFSLFFTYIWCT